MGIRNLRKDTKIGVISLGCAKNLVNTEQMMSLLAGAGYSVSGDTDNADAVLINTCGFIESAKTEAIETILEVSENANRNGQNPDKSIIVAGCLPERYKDEIMQEIPEIDAVVGTGSFDEIVGIVDEVLSSRGKKRTQIQSFCDNSAPVSEAGRIITTSPVWAYLKIAEGCDNRCAYCCIPSIRGSYRSRPIEAVVNEADNLAQRGYKELILVAQDTTAYGIDLYGKRSLTTLLKKLGEIEKLKWIRIMYMYPDGFDNELIDEIRNSGKIVKYLDIPIQHINDEILLKMNRRGTNADIRALFRNLRESIPGVVLRTSLITGLPGEGEREYKELCEFLGEFKIERAGVFPYSPEEGTLAAKMDYPSSEIAIIRARKIQKIQSKVMKEYAKSRIGTVTEALIEGYDALSANAEEVLLARSYAEAPDADGYIRISKYPKTAKPHTFAKVKITGICGGEPVGEMIN